MRVSGLRDCSMAHSELGNCWSGFYISLVWAPAVWILMLIFRTSKTGESAFHGLKGWQLNPWWERGEISKEILGQEKCPLRLMEGCMSMGMKELCHLESTHNWPVMLPVGSWSCWATRSPHILKGGVKHSDTRDKSQCPCITSLGYICPFLLWAYVLLSLIFLSLIISSLAP